MAKKSSRAAAADSPGISGVVEASSTPGAADFEVPDDGLDDDEAPPLASSAEPSTPAAPWVFDPYAPCPFCGEFYPHVPPPGMDVSGGIAYPALVYHFQRKHPDETAPPLITKED